MTVNIYQKCLLLDTVLNVRRLFIFISEETES